MTAAPHALRRFGAVVLALVLTGTVLVVAPSEAGAQETREFSDLDETTHAEAIRLVAEDGITRGYPDGTFRPRENVRRDQMATFLAAALRLDPRTPQFPDVPAEHVHADGIGAIAHADITRGYPDGTYRPLGEVTRGQMATFLAKGLELPAGTSTFSDVPEDYVHADAIAALADSGITEGYEDGTFRPNLPVKRDQMAAFLARGIPLPREPSEPECPGSRTATTSSQDSDSDSGSDTTTSSSGGEATSSTERDSEDLVELESAEARTSSEQSSATAASSHDLGPAVPGTAFPLTSVLRTSDTTLEVHSQDLATSRGARVEENGDITATTTIPAGRRTWATAQVGDHVYAGQWPPGSGTANLFRYSTSEAGDEASGDRTATAVATVPTGGEFWTLTADPRGRLWAGTRAHASGDFRAEIGLGDGRSDGRHVVHRIDPASDHAVTNVTFCLPDPPTTNGGVRPDIKHLAAVGDTLYVGTGQQAGGARLYAFEPGDRTDVPAGEVRDITPRGVAPATGVFAMTATDRYVAIGTQASGSDSARLVVVDRATEQARVNIWLQGESRVDAIALRDDRVVASGFSGSLYDVTIPSSGVRTEAPTPIESPVARQFHRFVEIRADDSLRGVTQRGVVWTRPASGVEDDIERVNLVDTGAPVAPGLPHSLHVGSADIVVGASSAATLRDTSSPDDLPRTVTISGEAKAVTSDAAGNTFLATYPNAGLWRVEAGGDEAELLRSWTADYRRPAAADFDDRRARVNVVAREDNNPQSDPRDDPQANFQFRPSRLFSMDPNLTIRADGVLLGRGGDHTSTVSAGTSATRPVEASALRNDETLGGADAFVGDTFGGVQRIDTTNGDRRWYRPAATGQGDRRVIDLELVDGVLVVVQTGSIHLVGGGTQEPLTVIRELDPATGEELSNHVVRNSGGNSFNVGDAVTSGDVTVVTTRTSLRYVDRSTGDYRGVGFAERNDTFGGPYVDLDRAGCQLYSFERTPSHLVRNPFEEGACAPIVDLPVDGGS